MKIFKKDLILKKDTEFKENIKVVGKIFGYFNLKVAGDINARDIDARNIDAGDINARNIDAWNIDAGDIVAGDIDAWNIDAGNINARNIDAWNIDAGDIDARNIVCEKRIKKEKTAKTKARVFIQNKSKLVKKEW